ncbi:MAG: hypothetical protein OXI79_13200, partial [Gammaproteobacteria bacterium]|nr:hypothetical protein [Gammaproteobacteria bacterium]
MGKLPTFVLIAALVLGGQFWLRAAWSDSVHGQFPVGQTPPETVLGQDDEATYKLFTPESVVTGGLPAQGGETGNCLKTTGSALGWGDCGSGGGGGGGDLSACTVKRVVTDATAPFYVADWEAGDMLAIFVEGDSIGDKQGGVIFPAPGTNSSVALPEIASYGYCSTPNLVKRSAQNQISVTGDGSPCTPWAISEISCAGGGGGAPLSDDNPKPLGTASPGVASKASRGDHVHKRPAEIAENTAAIAANAARIALKPSLSDAAPLKVGTANAGGATDASRQDHQHGWDGYGTNIKPIAAGSNAGILDQAARVDHVHAEGSARFVSDPTVQGIQDGWVLTVIGVDAYGWAAPSGGGSGAATFLQLGDTPRNYTGAASKTVTVNAAASGLEFTDTPPDLTDEVNDNTGAVEALDFLTQDIIAGTPSTGWATVTDASNAGIAVFSGAASCGPARAATYTPSVSSAGGKYPVVRVKAGFATANVRTLITGQGTATDLISGWALLCTSSDGGFAFYHPTVDGQTEAFGRGVSTAAVQTTGGAHIGTSKYQGDPTKVERWAITGNTDSIPVARTLPALTGNAGKRLTVNEDASGVKWIAGGGLELSDVPPEPDRIFGTSGVSPRASRGDHTHGSSTANEALEQKLAAVSIPIDLKFVPGKAADPVRIKLGSASQLLSNYQLASNSFTSSPSSQFVIDGVTVITTQEGGLFAWQVVVDFRCGSVRRYPLTDFKPATGVPDGWTGWTFPVRASGSRITCQGNVSSGFRNPILSLEKANELPTWNGGVANVPAGSTDLPKPDSANGFPGSSNRWSPGDHSHPITGHDSVTWTRAEVSTLTGGGASGGV